MSDTNDNLPPILPIGTAVVTKVEVKGAGGDVTCPAGAVGTIVRAPVDAQHSYRVRLTARFHAYRWPSRRRSMEHC